jgi:hypothetical protein
VSDPDPDREEPASAIQDLKGEIQTFREEYAVESPSELAIELESGADGWDEVGRWRATERNLAITQAALQVEEAHRAVEA